MHNTQIYTAPLLALIVSAAISSLFAADPAPADPPAASGAAEGVTADPLPASPPSTPVSDISGDPEPATPPSKSASDVSGDPALAFAPGSTDPVPNPDSILSDPAPAFAPGETSEVVAAGSARPFLGVGFRDPSKPIVTTLYQGSTAFTLGINLGDEIISVNGQSVSSIESLRSILSTLAVGDATEVVIKRDGEELQLGPGPIGGRF